MTMNNTPKSGDSTSTRRTGNARPYSPPQLRHYGDLGQLTRGGNPAAKNDPGGDFSGKSGFGMGP